MTDVQTRVITESDLIRLDAKGQRFEVKNGELVPMSPVGFEHVYIVDNIYDVLKPFATRHKLGYVVTDNLIYVLVPAEDTEEGVRESRVPDLSFIRKEHFPKDYDIKRPFPGTPDLAVEVISPDESADEIMDKVTDYLAAGTEQVWVVYPRQKTVHQYTQQNPNTVRIYHHSDTFEPASLFPGLKINVADFFTIELFE